MTFNSLEFFAFFAIVLALYYRFGAKGQNRLMLVAGSVFYGAFDWRFLGLLYFSILVDYVVGRGLDGTDDQRRRKQLLGVSLVSQLGILAFFKYFDFFSTSAADTLAKVGLDVDPFTLEVLLPVGISFYTFQSLAYVFAVYRRQLKAEQDLVTFATFVAWFPQLVAGPIERAPHLMPQIRRRRDAPGWDRVESGATLILRGLVKKVVVADSMAGYVTDVYADPRAYGWLALTLATVGFAVQVYGDFSGYSDIARGASRLLGVELRRNFEQPFLSRDIREFWQRWHTSLGAWFVENVAQPLGGNSRGPRRAAFNVLLVFTLIGLWHGAAWTFVFWGFLNGVLVTTWRFLPVRRTFHPMKIVVADIPHIVFTFGLYCVGVAFFRAGSFGDALAVLGRIVTLRDGLGAPAVAALVPVMAAVVVVLDLAERRRRIGTIEQLRVRMNLGGVATEPEAAEEAVTRRLGPTASGVVVGLCLLGVLVFSGGTPTPFIYFQF